MKVIILNCRENWSSLEIITIVISATVGVANLKVLCHGSVYDFV